MPFIKIRPEVRIMSQSWTLLTAVTGASFLTLYGSGNFWLFILVLVMQTLEILTEWGSKSRRQEQGFDAKQNAIGKLMVLSLLFVAFVMDRVFILVAPDDLAVQMERWYWVTKSTLIWIIIGEGVCILKHIEHSEGRGAIPPVIRWVIRQIRVMDEKRWPHEDGAPHRRWWDDLTEKDIEEILARRKKREEAGLPVVNEVLDPEQRKEP